MKKFNLYKIIAIIFLSCAPVFAAMQLTKDPLDKEAHRLLNTMTLKEKIGQKLMLDLRHWCAQGVTDQPSCIQDLTALNSDIKGLLSQNHIGGLILFSNNIKTIAQITTFTNDLQQNMHQTSKLPLLIATDQEGGIVSRLQGDINVTFPGNMALTAAHLGHPQEAYGSEVGHIIARNLKAVGINMDFAPDVDVNVNPLNPKINVRSFSDDPKLVATLGLQLSSAIQAEGVAATLKHFPGHGDTTVDSHIGLPLVNHNLDEAWAIDLYPFKTIIEQSSPDVIMTAHIQFPALDNSQIYAAKAGMDIITPATLSRKIQYDLLRKQWGYQGIIVSDALDMGAIADNFDATDASIKAFQAGVDIALMPIAITQPDEVPALEHMIADIELAVLNGSISAEELDQSVLRIIKLKLKLGLMTPEQRSVEEKIITAEHQLADKEQHELESTITDASVTLVQNNANLLPIQLLPKTRIHILTPWLEQGEGMAVELTRLQLEGQLAKNLQVNYIDMSSTDFAQEKTAIDDADIIIVGHMANRGLPLNNLGFNEAQFAYQTLQYAKSQGKKTIFISLFAPYDLPNYRDVADAMLATYNFLGYSQGDPGYYRGPSMPALTRIIFGVSKTQARLPIDIPNPLDAAEIVYRRGTSSATNYVIPSFYKHFSKKI